VVPLLVSEWCGYDQSPLEPADVVERIRWYDEKARQDYWMLGFCPFTLGPVPPWGSHDYEFAYPAILDYMISVKDGENAKPAPGGNGDGNGDDEEQPCRGLPRVQYDRVYVLLPPGTGKAWTRAVVDATWDGRRYTIGGSADDAGIGDLNDRTVVAVNPSRWGDDLENFFETHYPGVRYLAVEADTPDQLVDQLDDLDL
jgi:hypothetical protein